MRARPRSVVTTVALVGLIVMGGCTPAAAPTAAPAKQAATTAPATKAADTVVPAPKPADSQAAKPAASADWQAEWDKTVAAAKKEGKVAVAGGPGELYRKAMVPFEKVYPEIKLDYTGFRGVDFTPKIAAERDGGQYLWDVYIGGWTTPLPLIPKGYFDPLRPAVILPEVLDDAKWHGGFDDGWVDNERKYEFQFQSRLTFFAYVNRDIVPESELSTVDQLVDPKWKGKIAVLDPRGTGPLAAFLGYQISVRKDESFVRKLLAQDLAIMPDGRPLAEAVVRGRYPIGLGVPDADISLLEQQGLTGNVKRLAPDSPEGRRLTSGFGNIMLMNRAPHPNPARVYINWLLSQEGQRSWVETIDQNSRRLDVPGPADTAPKPGAKYEFNERQWSPMERDHARAIEIAKEMIH